MNNRYKRVWQDGLGTKRKSGYYLDRETGDSSTSPLMIGISLLIMIGFFWVVFTGLDKGLQNRDKMLCGSAKISGNEKYLELCQCFYKSGDIDCIRK